MYRKNLTQYLNDACTVMGSLSGMRPDDYTCISNQSVPLVSLVQERVVWPRTELLDRLLRPCTKLHEVLKTVKITLAVD